MIGNLNDMYIIIIVFIYMIYLQTKKRKINPSKRIIVALIFLYLTIESFLTVKTSILNCIYPLFLLIMIGVIAGIATGLVAKIFKGEDGKWYQQGGIITILILIMAIVFKILFRNLILKLPGGTYLNAGGFSFMVVYSAQIITRSVVILSRCRALFE